MTSSGDVPEIQLVGAGNSAVVVGLPRWGPMLSPRVPNLVPIPGPRMERETPGQRPRPNYGHPHALGGLRGFSITRGQSLFLWSPRTAASVKSRVGAQYRVVAGQAACLYSLMRPSQRVVRTSRRGSGWSVVLSSGVVCRGGRCSSERCGR